MRQSWFSGWHRILGVTQRCFNDSRRDSVIFTTTLTLLSSLLLPYTLYNYFTDHLALPDLLDRLISLLKREFRVNDVVESQLCG